MTDAAYTGTGPALAPRRPLKSRDKAWAKVTAGWLARHGAHPNSISFCSSLFAAASGFCLYESGRADVLSRILCLLAAVAGVQLRLLCNLLDGMVALSANRRTATGEIWNDFPDRISDVEIFVPLGYGLRTGPAIALGWAAALLAIATAYVRVLAGSAGAQQRFLGPMAKQQRMALLTLGCAVATAEPWFAARGTVLTITLGLIAVGSLVTVVHRLVWLGRDLRAR